MAYPSTLPAPSSRLLNLTHLRPALPSDSLPRPTLSTRSLAVLSSPLSSHDLMPTGRLARTVHIPSRILDTTHHPGTSSASYTFVNTSASDATSAVTTIATHITTTTTIAAAASSTSSRRSSESSRTRPSASRHDRDRTPQDRSKSMSAVSTAHIRAALLDQAAAAASASASSRTGWPSLPPVPRPPPPLAAAFRVRISLAGRIKDGLACPTLPPTSATSPAFAPTLSKLILPLRPDSASMQESGSSPSHDPSSTDSPLPSLPHSGDDGLQPDGHDSELITLLCALTLERGMRKPALMEDASHECTRRERGGVVCEDLDGRVIDDADEVEGPTRRGGYVRGPELSHLGLGAFCGGRACTSRGQSPTALDSERFQLWDNVNARPPLGTRAPLEAGLEEVAFTPSAREGRLNDVV
ncbi:hypothetical protein HETIRDRAFT_451089 [Heterobasidion irregulare TC 32-1]|uniref:Uncharacterized protein n=1 Tax=Heterobasidion irregulare (strain TC 32-1) TaxID=747525 RepID=W4K854_HETIT|nr:uncharacterized protein HETIRDRAFT_451089 [Heterobasidion irregulare TC 32-1]ETW81246.1 hypothetical protein HETIRDRAFT_451089 [Heterobasidion irregulare TC 32-1]